MKGSVASWIKGNIQLNYRSNIVRPSRPSPKIVTTNGGERQKWGGVRFYNGGAEVSLHSRVMLTPLFYEDPLPILPISPYFFKCFPTPHFLVTSNLTSSVLFVVLFLMLNGWSCHIWCAEWWYGSTHVEPWYLSTRRTLMCVLCNKTEVWHNVVFHCYSDITHTNKHSTLRGQ